MPDPSARQTPSGQARARWLFLFFALTLFAVVDSFHDYLSRREEGHPVDGPTELIAGVLFWGPCIALVPIIIALFRRWPLNFGRPASIGLHALAALVFVYVNVMIQAVPTRFFPPTVVGYWERFFFSLKFDFALDYSFYCIVVISVYLLRQYEEMKERELRASQLEAGLAESRLRALQSQLNPHFFFNALQSISVMAMAGQSEAVVETLGRLGGLLRVLFDKRRPAQVPLAEEIDFLDGFLAIHQVCFGQRLTVERDFHEATLNAFVPTMLLQPLVENAIVHGVSVKPGAGILRISSRRIADGLQLEVSDNGPGFQMSEPARSGVGLSATETRLNLLFGPHHRIEYGRSPLGGALVRVQIPFASSVVIPAGRLAHPALQRQVAARP